MLTINLRGEQTVEAAQPVLRNYSDGYFLWTGGYIK